jgi:hypothetical protein
MDWIKVEDNLPDYDELVLWWCPSGNYYLFDIDKDMDWQWIEERFGNEDKAYIPSHWARLPKGPE